jgi:hypothetical protein
MATTAIVNFFTTKYPYINLKKRRRRQRLVAVSFFVATLT